MKEYKIIKNNLFPILAIKNNISDICGNTYEDIAKYFINKIGNDYVECGFIIAYDCNNEIIGIFNYSKGERNICLNCYNEIFTFLLLSGASCFLRIHNHPNNINNFSQEDINSDICILNVSKILKIKYLASIIVTEKNFKYINYNS